jgi:hypothetical protein
MSATLLDRVALVLGERVSLDADVYRDADPQVIEEVCCLRACSLVARLHAANLDDAYAAVLGETECTDPLPPGTRALHALSRALTVRLHADM